MINETIKVVRGALVFKGMDLPILVEHPFGSHNISTDMFGWITHNTGKNAHMAAERDGISFKVGNSDKFDRVIESELNDGGCELQYFALNSDDHYTNAHYYLASTLIGLTGREVEFAITEDGATMSIRATGFDDVPTVAYVHNNTSMLHMNYDPSVVCEGCVFRTALAGIDACSKFDSSASYKLRGADWEKARVGNCRSLGRTESLLNARIAQKSSPEQPNDFTKMFADKTGDTIIVELELTGPPDKVAKHLYESIKNDSEIFDGAKCNQILFKGKNIDDLVKEAKDKAIKEIKNALDGIA